MKTTVALTLSLVIFSGGAGFGLSAYNDLSTATQTASLSTPEIISDASTGFVIPQYVPAVRTMVSVPVRATPEFETPEIVTTPSLAFAPMTQQFRPQMRPAVRVALASPAQGAQTTASFTAVTRSFVPNAVEPGRQAPADRAVPSNLAPKFYTDPAFSALDNAPASNAPKYVVGVYR